MSCEVFSLTFPQILWVFFFYIARLCTQARKKKQQPKTLCMNRMWEIIHKLEDILILVFLPHPTPYALFSTPFPHLAFFSPATLSTPCTCLAHWHQTAAHSDMVSGAHWASFVSWGITMAGMRRRVFQPTFLVFSLNPIIGKPLSLAGSQWMSHFVFFFFFILGQECLFTKAKAAIKKSQMHLISFGTSSFLEKPLNIDEFRKQVKRSVTGYYFVPFRCETLLTQFRN